MTLNSFITIFPGITTKVKRIGKEKQLTVTTKSLFVIKLEQIIYTIIELIIYIMTLMCFLFIFI
jgi:hypothetical protein